MIFVFPWNKFHHTVVRVTTKTRRSKRWRRAMRAARSGNLDLAYWHLVGRRREP